ncbi:MAG: phosphatidate cytidylyltransferase [Oscillospiraceae bacterium]|nr:phosphatidate cytidylyltransferase [Oscillospiraceae bacterium]
MKKRVISAVILIAITLICVFASYVTRVLFFAVAGILCAYEFSRCVEKINVYCCAWVMYVYIAIQAVLTLFRAGVLAYIACMAGGIYLALFSGILHRKVSGSGALFTLAGLSYPCFLFGLLMAIGVSSIWLPSLVVAAISTWSCDSFALFGGMRFGKHKLAPAVSPNKTIEGCLCGALASLVAALILYLLRIFPQISLPVYLITALLASSLGQIGDLAESLIKRMIGVKDFSDLIPGHGGMFDRADSLLFSIPTAYLCLYIAGIAA